ncbi:MAG: hypothetical protein SFY95_03795 [Planctomycetota bacterium]|nr:hypothetical protein [Planctomycetota bacterium]
MRAARPRCASALVALALLAGCESAPDRGDEPPRDPVVFSAPLKSPAAPERQPSANGDALARESREILARYNARVARLESLFARLTMEMRLPDETGEIVSEQAEGQLLLRRPTRLALFVNKVGETYFQLGCNDRAYWWLDLREPRTAMAGRHDRARAETAAEFGIFVHPLDLIELLAVMPLDADAPGTRLVREGATLTLTQPARWGEREVVLDASTARPISIALLTRDAQGRSTDAARATYERFAPVNVRGGLGEGNTLDPEMPVRLRLVVPASRAEVRMNLFDPENRGDTREAPYSLQELTERYGIQRLINLDEQDPAEIRRARDEAARARREKEAAEGKARGAQEPSQLEPSQLERAGP